MFCQIADDILTSISYVESQLGSRTLISAQIRAARSLIRWTADELAAASALSVATIRRAELKESETSLTAANDLAIRRALEAAGVEFIDENGGGPGVRLRKRHQSKS
jgi:transcriptional regulator with XRE-family HTH domain